jgi:glutathione S-transferase
MNMKFYMTPGSCSTAINIILEELGEIFEAHIVNLPAGDQFKPEFLAINPKANIPALMRPDGSVLTEVPAIAYWLGRARGRGKLWPKEIEDETRAIETMSFVAGSLHGHGFARIFAPGNFCPDSSLQGSIKAQGRALVVKGFAILDKALEGRSWIAGDFSVADAVMFYVEFWADKTGIAMPPNLLAHYRAMLGRPVVSQVLREEGYRPELLGQRVAG